MAANDTVIESDTSPGVTPGDVSLEAAPPAPVPERTGRAAALVAVGIFTSRIMGLVRQRVFAHYFAVSDVADAFQAAFRIPNLLQNLFGEGVLSASFIPEYANLLARGDRDTARKLAGAVFTALALVTSLIVLLGILAVPYVVDVVAGGYGAEKRALTVTLVRILFPGAALLVFSAWCLGILNSHRRFLLSYAAPIAWNVAMIGALVMFGPRREQHDLVIILAIASVIGSAAQFVVQLPTVIRLAGNVRPHLNLAMPAAMRVFRQFTSAFLSRGVVQISAFIDMMLASYLIAGTVTALTYAQTLYLLPGSLFGMSVSAAELPAMSSVIGTTDHVASHLRERLASGMQRIAYFVVPCVVVFLVLGDVVVGALFQTGLFRRAQTVWVWQILAGSTVGLLASTLGRINTSVYYALRDTRTPLRYAILRLILTTVLGIVFAFGVPRWFDLDPHLAAVGLTVSAGIAGWVEFAFLRRGLTRRIGAVTLPPRIMGSVWIGAVLAAAVAWGVRLVIPSGGPIVDACIVLGTFGVLYGLMTVWLRVPTAVQISGSLARRMGRG